MTHKIKKEEGTFYWDWDLIDGNIIIYQEKEDGRRSINHICNSPTNSIQEFGEEYIEDFIEDDGFIYFTVKDFIS